MKIYIFLILIINFIVNATNKIKLNIDNNLINQNNNINNNNNNDMVNINHYNRIKLISNDGKSCNRTLIYGECSSNLCGGAALLINGEQNDKNTGYTVNLGFQCNNFLNKSPFLCDPSSTFQYTISGITYNFNVVCYNETSDSSDSNNSNSDNNSSSCNDNSNEIQNYNTIKLSSNDGQSCSTTILLNKWVTNMCGNTSIMIDNTQNQLNTGYTVHIGGGIDQYIIQYPFICKSQETLFSYNVKGRNYSFNAQCIYNQ